MNVEENIIESEEKILTKHTIKSFFLALLNGFLVGLAVILPGISGATISILFKLYDKIVYAISNIFKKFKLSFFFLLPIIIGVIIGFLLGFLAIQNIIDKYTFILVCLFAGLMLGASKEIYKEILHTQISTLRIILLIVGFIFPITLASVFANVQVLDLSSYFTSFPIWLYFLSFIVGILVSITQLVPGLSATVLLMSIGFFTPIMNNLHISTIFSKPQWIIFLLIMVVGFIVGFFLFSKIMNHFFSKHKTTTFYLLTGLTFGSIVSIFYNSDVKQVYEGWGNNQGNITLDLAVGIPLFIISVLLTYFLIRYKEQKNIEKESKIK